MPDMVQLMLTAPCAADTAEPLKAALADVAVACVLITPPGWSAPTQASNPDEEVASPGYDQAVCQTLVDLIQQHDTAALIANDSALAQATGADGCHFDPRVDLEDVYRNARAFLGRDAALGIMPATSRHTAMALAEAGADYIGYAITSAADTVGLDHVAWWAEIFESSVVAFTDGDIATGRLAIERGPPDFLATPLLIDGKADHLHELARLIEACGQLPIAAKDAK